MENTIQSSKKKYLINFGTNCISTFLSILYYLCTYKYKLFQEPFPDIIFQIHLRRKTLFYVVNLIIPCVGISFLSVLVFYLPSDSGRQIDNMRQIDNIGEYIILDGQVILDRQIILDGQMILDGQIILDRQIKFGQIYKR